MRVAINGNVVTVVSDIPMAAVEAGYADLTACDEKKNPVYRVAVNLEGNGNLSQFGMVANTVCKGKLAVVMVEPLGTTRDDIKRKYGKAVVAAAKYCPVIAAAAASEEMMINSAFGDLEEVTE